MPRVRLSVAKSTDLSKTSVVVVERSLAALLRQGGNKLRVKAKRAFTDAGAPLADDAAVEALEDGTLCVLTTGAVYEGRFPEPPPAPAAPAGAGAEAEAEADGEEAREPEPDAPRPPAPADEQRGTVVVLANESWLEQAAVDQLEACAALPGCVLAAGMPDLHPGKGYPIGAAVVTRGVVYGHLVGGDIGCGMSLVQLPLPARRASAKRIRRWTEQLRELERRPLPGTLGDWLTGDKAWPQGRPVPAVDVELLEAAGGLPPADEFVRAMGTPGGGNHFAELVEVESVEDEAAFAALGLDAGRLQLVVHSGSRGLGGAVLGRHAGLHGTAGLPVASAAGAEYVALHEQAKRFARRNRCAIATRFADALGVDPSQLHCALDIFHNSVEPLPSAGEDSGLWVHRKGAAPASVGAVVIPGSRGHVSYLVVPTGDSEALDRCGWSMAHGAGRKWHRHKALASMKQRHPHADDLRTTELGSSVICDDKQLLYEEAPQAYKDVSRVIGDLVSAGIVTVVAVLRPLVTYKTAV